MIKILILILLFLFIFKKKENYSSINYLFNENIINNINTDDCIKKCYSNELVTISKFNSDYVYIEKLGNILQDKRIKLRIKNNDLSRIYLENSKLPNINFQFFINPLIDKSKKCNCTSNDDLNQEIILDEEMNLFNLLKNCNISKKEVKNLYNIINNGNNNINLNDKISLLDNSVDKKCVNLNIDTYKILIENNKKSNFENLNVGNIIPPKKNSKTIFDIPDNDNQNDIENIITQNDLEPLNPKETFEIIKKQPIKELIPYIPI
tara:strand:+ start:292 stop:1083 length:792 start_codon:yes stop_codon:yes gene_type:complete